MPAAQSVINRSLVDRQELLKKLIKDPPEEGFPISTAMTGRVVALLPGAHPQHCTSRLQEPGLAPHAAQLTSVASWLSACSARHKIADVAVQQDCFKVPFSATGSATLQ